MSIYVYPITSSSSGEVWGVVVPVIPRSIPPTPISVIIWVIPIPVIPIQVIS